MKATLLISTAVAVLAGCSGARVDGEVGRVSITIARLAAQSQIEEVRLTANPGGYSTLLVWDGTTAQFLGSMSLPPGEYTLTADATGDTNGDNVQELLASGTATATIVAGQTTVVFMRIWDMTGPPPVPDHGPVITSVTISNASGVVNQPLTFSVSAVDVDGDALTYAWSETYCSSGVPSTFSDPTSAVTNWTPAAEGYCHVRVDATSNGLTDSAYFLMQVPSGLGTVQVGVTFFPYPTIMNIQIRGEGPMYPLNVGRGDTNATVWNDVAPGQSLQFVQTTNLSSNFFHHPSTNLTDDCGGTPGQATQVGPYEWGATWVAPAAPAVCIVSATITVDSTGQSDTFPVVLHVANPVP